jgi:hypothetical protein
MAHFKGRQEEGAVSTGYIDIRLREKFKNVQKQVFVFFRDLFVEVLEVISEVDFVWDPVHLLLHFISFEGPVVFEWFVVGAFL